jgi:hypothetical protein
MLDGAQTKVLEDFTVRDASTLSEDHEMLRWLSDTFERDYKKCIDDRKDEILGHRNLFENKDIPDYWNLYADDDGEEDKSDYLYGSGEANKFINSISSIITDSRPKVYLTPIFSENFDEIFSELVKELPKDIQEHLAQIGQEVGNPSAAAKEWVNQVCDALYNAWAEKANVKQKYFLLVQRSKIDSESYIKTRPSHIEAGEIEQEIVSNLNICFDTDATTWREIKHLCHIDKKHVRDIERKFKLPKGTITPAPEYSRGYDKDTDSYQVPNALVVEMYLRDASVVPGTDTAKYPYGRKITFVPNQNEDCGSIYVISDEPWTLRKWPFAKLMASPDNELFGISPMRHIGRLQHSYDKAGQLMVANLFSFGTDKLFYEEGAFEENKPTNGIGETIALRSQGKQLIDYHKANPSVEASLMVMGDVRNTIRNQTRLFESTEGTLSRSQLSGKAISGMREASLTRFRPDSRFFEEVVRESGYDWCQLAIALYKKGKEYYHDGEQRQLYFDLSDLIWDFQVEVAEDSSLPRDPSFQAETILNLANNPNLSVEQVRLITHTLKLDNAEEITAQFERQIGIKQKMEQAAQEIQRLQEISEQFSKENQKIKEENMNMKLQLLADVEKGNVALKVEESRAKRDMTKQRTDLVIAEMNATVKQQTAQLDNVVKLLQGEKKPVSAGTPESNTQGENNE